MEKQKWNPGPREGWLIWTGDEYLIFTTAEPKLIIGHDGEQVWSDASWVNLGMYSIGSEVSFVPESIKKVIPENAPLKVKYTWSQEEGYKVYE